MNRQLEREEDQLEQDLAAGLISQSEFNREMREIQRDYRESAHEAAGEAYRDELERW